MVQYVFKRLPVVHDELSPSDVEALSACPVSFTSAKEIGIDPPITGTIGDSQNPNTLKTDTHTGSGNGTLSIVVT